MAMLGDLLSALLLNNKSRNGGQLFDQYQNDAMIPKSVDITPQGTNPNNFDYNTLARMPTAADLSPYYARALALGQDPTNVMKLQQYQDQARSDARSLNAQRQPVQDLLSAFQPRPPQNFPSPQSNENPTPIVGQVTPPGPSAQSLAPILAKLVASGFDIKPLMEIMKSTQPETTTLSADQSLVDKGTGRVIATGASKEKARPATPEELSSIGAPPDSKGVIRKPDGTFELATPNFRVVQPPSGYQFAPDGTLTPIKGGPADQNVLVSNAGAEAKARAAAQAPDQGDESVETMANGIANYQMAPLTNFSLTKPFGQAVNARVLQLNPQYQAQNYTKSQQAYKDFGSGKKGDLVRSFNVGISHLDTLGDLADALNNGNVQTVNAVAQRVKQEFGSTAPTNFNAAKAIVGDEIIKAIVGSGGALADRENAQNQIKAANTPAQLKGVIDTYQKLMGGQLMGLKRQYEASTMRRDFDSLLSDQTKSKLEGAAPTASAQPAGGWTVQRVP